MILVTGGAGYIGSHVVANLIEHGFDVVIFDNLENGSRDAISSLMSMQERGEVRDFFYGDLKNKSVLTSVFKKHQIDAVIHLAAYIRVEESVMNPQKYYYNNLVGSLNLATAMIENNVDKIVFSSTAAVYGEPKYVPMDEEHPLNPINPYGFSKMVVENILEEYGKAYKLRSARLRYFNVVGADSQTRIGECHEPESHLVPNILMSASNPKKEFQLYGDDYNTKDGTCIRDYVNVEDLAEAHLLALRYLINGGKTDCFNLGTAKGYTVKEVFAACEKITGRQINVKVSKRRAGDPESLVADNKKAKKILGWSPRRSLEDSIKTAYSWIMRE